MYNKITKQLLVGNTECYSLDQGGRHLQLPVLVLQTCEMVVLPTYYLAHLLFGKNFVILFLINLAGLMKNNKLKKPAEFLEDICMVTAVTS